MDLQEVIKELEQFGNDTTKRIYMNHGAKEPLFGVKVGDLKKLLKKIKKNHELALELFSTGNSDAMYLAGLIADEKQITREQLIDWAEQANWYMLSEYVVGNLTAESPFGKELSLKWIDDKRESIASSGWAALSGVLALENSDKPNVEEIRKLLERILDSIHNAPNRVRYAMNNFLIAVGTYLPELTDNVIEVANKIGKVTVNMGKTSCKVPYAPDYIKKVVEMGRVGVKRKAVRC